MEGNYIVRAAHVLWGLPRIDVLLEDGTEHQNVPVAAYDHFADLAFLGPMDGGPMDGSATNVQFAEIERNKQLRTTLQGSPGRGLLQRLMSGPYSKSASVQVSFAL